MEDAPTSQRSRAIPLIVLGCAGWLAVAAGRVLLHWTGGLDGALALAAAALPPIIAAVVAGALLRRDPASPADDPVPRRLAAAGDSAAAITERLRLLDEALGGSLAQTERMAEAASGQGQGLGASATALGLAAGELVNAGQEATRAATTLSASVPELGRQVADLDVVLRRLGSETADQLLAIDTVLARVGVHSREAAAEGGAAIAAMTRQLAAIDERSQELTSALAKRAYALDAAIDGVLERSLHVIDDVGAKVTAQTGSLEARLDGARGALDDTSSHASRVVAERIDQLAVVEARLTQLLTDHDQRSRDVIELTDRHLADLPARLEEAGRSGEAAMSELAGRVTILHRNLDGLQTPVSAAEAALGALGGQLDLLRRVADELGVGLAGRLPATVAELRNLDLGAVALVERVDGLRDTLVAGTEVTRILREMVGATRLELATMGEADARLVGDRLEALIVTTGELGDRIAAQRLASDAAGEAIDHRLDAVTARLATAQTDSAARLTAMTDHLGSVHGGIADLAEPLRAARSVLGDIDAQLEHFSSGMTDFGAGLDSRVATADAALAALTQNAAGVLERTDALHQSIAAGATAVDDASAAFARERGTLAAHAEVLAGQFDKARVVLDGLRAETAGATEDAQTRLAPAIDHARGLAEAGAAAMQDMLVKVVADAEAALERSGSAVAERAFAGPILAQLGEVEAASARAGDAAEAASLRVGDHARALDGAIASVEDKLAEMETRIEVRDRDTLSARSVRLIEQLGDASINVADLLTVDVGETAWAEYLGGDRSVFARRAVRIFDRETLRKVARHYEHDAAFKAEAVRYIDTFETLTRRVLNDPDGEALMAMMLSSDLGKLYVVIARATERWLPARG